MSSSIETDSMQDVINFIQGLRPIHVHCECRNFYYPNTPSYYTDFVPRYEIAKEAGKFTVRVWYVCSSCGRELK